MILVSFMSSSGPRRPLLKQRPSGVYFPLVWRMSKACVSVLGSNVSSHVLLITSVGFLTVLLIVIHESALASGVTSFHTQMNRLSHLMTIKSALVIMSYWCEQTKLIIICFTNPILNAFNWLCALASQLYCLVSFRVSCIAFTCLYSSLSCNKLKGEHFQYIFSLIVDELDL